MNPLLDRIRVEAVQLFASTDSPLTKNKIEYLFGI